MCFGHSCETRSGDSVGNSHKFKQLSLSIGGDPALNRSKLFKTSRQQC